MCMMEGNRKNKPRVLLVFGAPASGKTTFAEKFAKKSGLASYDLKTLIEEYGFTYEMIMVLVEQILKTGQTILIEGAIDTERDRAKVRNMARKYRYEPALIWIQTDTNTILGDGWCKAVAVDFAANATDDFLVDIIVVSVEIREAVTHGEPVIAFILTDDRCCKSHAVTVCADEMA